MKIKTMLSLSLIVLFQSNTIFAQSIRPKFAENGMVVSPDHLASEVGVKILKQGGNAIDAAIATAFALAVTFPACGNIGGDGFILYHGADGTVTSFDFRIKAPLAATKNMFLDKNGQMKHYSIFDTQISVGVPGTVAGLELAHKRLGSKPWKDLLKPAIELAENGFIMTYDCFKDIRSEKKHLIKHPSTLKAFYKSDSTFYEPGELFKQPDLAKTLKRIQKYGKDDFYTGKTAKLIVDFMEKNGGLITYEDLKNYKAIERQPIHGTYRGYDIYSMGLPSGGGIIMTEILNILEGYDIKEAGYNSAKYVHLLSEAMKIAYTDRAKYLGDPEFNTNIPVDKLISKEYAKECRKTIQLDKASKSDPKHIQAYNESTETTHFSVIDKDGNAVSLTYTLNGDFGSYAVVPGGGFFLNNDMSDFNPVPGQTSRYFIGTKPNLIEPGKRALSSMSPTVVAKDGKPILVLGTPGGLTIPTTVLQIIINVIDFDMNIAEAIAAPRIFRSFPPNEICVEERGISKDTQQLLEMMGHELYISDNDGWTFGRAMGIFVDIEKNIFYGAADPRGYQCAALGY